MEERTRNSATRVMNFEMSHVRTAPSAPALSSALPPFASARHETAPYAHTIFGHRKSAFAENLETDFVSADFQSARQSKQSREAQAEAHLVRVFDQVADGALVAPEVKGAVRVAGCDLRVARRAARAAQH